MAAKKVTGIEVSTAKAPLDWKPFAGPYFPQDSQKITRFLENLRDRSKFGVAVGSMGRVFIYERSAK